MEYREIFEKFLAPLKEAGYPEKNQVWAAQKLTDAVWEIMFEVSADQADALPEALTDVFSKAAKTTLDSNRLRQYMNSNWFSE